MAVIALLLGGVLGFFSGMIALLIGIELVFALGLWLAVGLGSSGLIGLFALLPRRAVTAKA